METNLMIAIASSTINTIILVLLGIKIYKQSMKINRKDEIIKSLTDQLFKQLEEDVKNDRT